MNNLLQRKSIVIPFTFLLFVWITAICIPLISPYSDDINGAVNFKIGPTPPSLSHWFGTDIAGRDMFTLTIYAGISSLKVGIISILIAVLIGMPLGIVAGLEKGWIGNAIMRISDSFLAFPPLILPMLITAVLGPSLSNVIIGIGISWFPWYTRIARAQALIISEQDYVLVSKSMGANRYHILKKHIFPNSLSPVLVQATIDVGYAILISSGLSFIGLGAQPPEVEWGLLITQSRAQFLSHWWVVFFPGIFIILSVISFNLIGDGIKSLLSPRLNL
jgi:peptide/nickel transport system permease protein